MPALLLAIGRVAITVSDMARATAFYRDKVGLPFLFGAGGMAFFDCGGIRLMLPSRKPCKPAELSSQSRPA